jgi:hypothetical protein
MLTAAQREYLQQSATERDAEYSRQARNYHDRSIQDRVIASLLDFAVLARHLDVEERQGIVDALRERHRIQYEVALRSTIRFLYSAVGGETGFRQALEQGVSRGEVDLGNAEVALAVAPLFRSDRAGGHQVTDMDDVIDVIEDGQWAELTSSEVYAFLRWSHGIGAIDFDRIRASVNQRDVLATMREEEAAFDAALDAAVESNADN